MSDCIFCKIISGEIPSYTIYEDDYFKVIMDIFPSAMGHSVIIPKHHCRDLFELPKAYGERITEVSKKAAKAVKEALQADGINIVQNNGEAAGQTVMHYHMHVIPRFEQDGVKIGWDSLKPSQEELLSIFGEIKERIKQNAE